MRPHYIFIVLFSIISLSINAQQKGNGVGKIRGKIIDSISGEAIEYATISLVTQESNKIIDGTTTDTNGVFKLGNIAEGKYKLLIYFIGYKTTEQNNIIISSSNPELSLGKINLVNRQILMKEVTVSGEKNIIENQIDKLVYNA